MKPDNVSVGDTVEDKFTGNVCTVTDKEALESGDTYVQLESIHDKDIGVGTRHTDDINAL